MTVSHGHPGQLAYACELGSGDNPLRRGYTKAYSCGYEGCPYSGVSRRALRIHVNLSGHRPTETGSLPGAGVTEVRKSESKSSDQNDKHDSAGCPDHEDLVSGSSLADQQPSEEGSEPTPLRRKLNDSSEPELEGEADRVDDISEDSRRQVNIEPVIGPMIAQQAIWAAQQTSDRSWDSPTTLDIDLSAEEATLAAVLQKLSTADQDALLKVIPLIAGQLRWKSSKEYAAYMDAMSTQVQ